MKSSNSTVVLIVACVTVLGACGTTKDDVSVRTESNSSTLEGKASPDTN